jgi:hypothetical protein
MVLMVPAGLCLSPRISWAVPVLVQAEAVRGAAACTVSIPHPVLGSWQSDWRRATASSGRSAA